MNTDATLARILECWLDGGLPDDQQADLLRQLREDPELRRRFAEQVATMGGIRAAADANPRWLALFDLMNRSTEGPSVPFEVVTMKRIKSANRRKRHEQRIAWALAAVVTLLMAGGFLWSIRDRKTFSQTAPAVETEKPLVAVITGTSPGSEYLTGSDLKAGAISQNEGWITFQTLNGVSVTLDAPFEAAVLEHDRVRLEKGLARVRVPQGAEGFRLESPAFDVVDLGTEFAARVNADGTGTCRVFEGKADVSLVDTLGEAKLTRRLTASKSVRISPSAQAVEMIEEKDSDYPEIKQAPRPKLRLSPSYAAGVMSLAPVGYWRFESLGERRISNEVPGGIGMIAQGGAAIAAEGGGNHSGELTRLGRAEFFKLQGGTNEMFAGDFTIGFFAQFSWMQNFAMISAMRYDNQFKGHPLIFQCYASLSKLGINGSAIQAVLRDPPAWDGGEEVFAKARLQPLRWHHLAMTRRDGIVTIHLDGEVVVCETMGAMPLDCREIFIGRLNGNTMQSRTEARGMVGHIDEFAIFRRALSDEEIARLAGH